MQHRINLGDKESGPGHAKARVEFVDGAVGFNPHVVFTHALTTK